MKALTSLLLGFTFGAILIFSEAFHWYRIQEMFHFESFHMYGLLGSAILTGVISVLILKRFKVKSVYGTELKLVEKEPRRIGNVIGGLIFGMGWSLTGACTAPLIILAGWKWEIGLIGLGGALLGTLAFGLVKNKIPK
ncbi:MAG: putative membrane protein YedE/YeeE [Salibacteraceae bacterium]|jgi:uncharacterized membrane protein YedE/YeeE